VLSEKLKSSAFNKNKIGEFMSKLTHRVFLIVLLCTIPQFTFATTENDKESIFVAQPVTQSEKVEYKLLATNKTSTMQKEMNEAAEAGFRFGGVMGGETSFGGSEVVVIMTRQGGPKNASRYRYRLLATNKTSTMQKELQEAGNEGFEYKGQTVYGSTFGGKEVMVILERDLEARIDAWEYKLLATKKTGTMQKELSEAGEQGYEFVGVTVSDTAFGGREVVSILRRPVRK
jgi:hypothetical protein